MPPPLLYGTAWKEGETERLTALAIAEGFRGIDTANQRKHYFEEAVGRAVQGSIARGVVLRGELFLQTKFTFQDGQDHRLPYDPKAPIATQVEQSFASSLQHFGTTSIESFVLHGPSQSAGLGPDDHAAWRAMEALHARGLVTHLGVSNVSLAQLRELTAFAKQKPAFVQNRCYARRGWDREIRAFCRAEGMVYQGFSLLTANAGILANPRVIAIARRLKRTPAQVVFRFAIQLGMLPLTGTTDVAHMRADLETRDFALEDAEVEAIERLG